MSNNRGFIVDNLTELRALQRVFREAKFCTEPDDKDIAGSPIVAQLFERLMEVLIEQQVTREGDEARRRWNAWLQIDDSRDEWFAAIRRAKADVRWDRFTESERANYVKILLSPFVLSREMYEKFIVAVNEVPNQPR